MQLEEFVFGSTVERLSRFLRPCHAVFRVMLSCDASCEERGCAWSRFSSVASLCRAFTCLVCLQGSHSVATAATISAATRRASGRTRGQVSQLPVEDLQVCECQCVSVYLILCRQVQCLNDGSGIVSPFADSREDAIPQTSVVTCCKAPGDSTPGVPGSYDLVSKMVDAQS